MVASKMRRKGSSPAERPPVEEMRDPAARTLLTETPSPPAPLDTSAHFLSVSKMPWIESSSTGRRKHDAKFGCLVPELNMVGVAWVK